MIKIIKFYLTNILIGLFLFKPVSAEYDIEAPTAILQDYFSCVNILWNMGKIA